MKDKKNITENFKVTLRLENEKISIPVPLTKMQMQAVQDILGLEIFDLGSRVYDVFCYADEDLILSAPRTTS